eukprot:9791007-Ditylum_brightwellii.AAC.1
MGEAPDIILDDFSVKVWETDEDMVSLRMHLGEECRAVWSHGMDAFIAGDWSTAVVKFNEVLEITNGMDGPSKHILGVMEDFQFTIPENWP